MSTLFEAGYKYANAKIHSISWGFLNKNNYGSTYHAVDVYMCNNPDFLVIAAAGNSGKGDNLYSVISPAVFKNGISVGASLNSYPHIQSFQSGGDYLDDFSGRGPSADSRRKPDRVAPGQFIRSARAMGNQNGVCGNSQTAAESELMFRAGTSMSAPIVSGAAAVVRQYFEEGWHINGKKNSNRGFNPRAILVKAVLKSMELLVCWVLTEIRKGLQLRSTLFHTTTRRAHMRDRSVQLMVMLSGIAENELPIALSIVTVYRTASPVRTRFALTNRAEISVAIDWQR
ncbi:hypothetical protein ACA910_000944 [Epithemia clementina (nom. ined.)]